MKRKPSRDGDSDDDDANNARPYTPGRTAELVATVLASDARDKRKAEPRATVLPRGDDSDDDHPRKNAGKSVSFADDDEAMAIAAANAAKTRALLRSEMLANMRDARDVDARESVDEAEERKSTRADEEDDGDDDEKFEPFNLERERTEGYFDEDGNYVEYAEERDETEAWLDKDAKVDERFATGAIKRSTALLEEEELARGMNAREIAEVQRAIAGYLNAGETVLGALKRLGGASDVKKSRSVGQKTSKVMSVEEKKAFDALTELSSALMSNGEYEVYTFQKEAFERAAALNAPLPKATNDGGGKDMFADSDDEDARPATTSKTTRPAKKVKAEEAPKSSLTLSVDFASMSVGKLKQYIKSHGGSVEGNISEKLELVERAQACAPAFVPEGYVYDTDKDMYYCAASNMWFHHSTRLFTTDGHKWWSYDADKGFVECTPV